MAETTPGCTLVYCRDGNFVSAEVHKHLNLHIAPVLFPGCCLEVIPVHRSAIELAVLAGVALYDIIADLLILAKTVVAVGAAVVEFD